MKTKVAIQGIKGSFHDEVAQQYFGNQLEILPCDSFDQLVQSVVDGKCHQASNSLRMSSTKGLILTKEARSCQVVKVRQMQHEYSTRNCLCICPQRVANIEI